ncbi:hypothetical protein GCM10010295_61980 [Streptomyces intermedius]
MAPSTPRRTSTASTIPAPLPSVIFFFAIPLGHLPRHVAYRMAPASGYDPGALAEQGGGRPAEPQRPRPEQSGITHPHKDIAGYIPRVRHECPNIRASAGKPRTPVTPTA